MQSAIDIANAQGEQDISSLGKLLFPDPSKAAHSYYYGAEARKAQIDALAKQNQMVYLQHYLAQQRNPTAGVPPLVYGPPPLANMTAQVPQAPAPGAYNPGSNPAAAATMGAGATPALNTAFDQVQAQTSQPLPETGAPVPGASPQTPQTTRTDGGTPMSDGRYNPASILPPGGGVIMAPPAGTNGSMQPPAVTLPGLVAMGQASGMDAANSQAGGAAFIAQSVMDGRMSKPMGEWMLAGTGVTAPYTTRITDTGATTRTGLEVAGREKTTAMTIGGENYRAGLPLQTVVDPNDPTKVIMKPLSQMQGLGGTPGYNPAAVPEAVKPVLTQPGGPTTPPVSQTQAQAQQQRTPIYQPEIEQTRQQERGKIGLYYHPSNPTQLLERDVDQAAREGLLPAAKTPEQVTAQTTTAAINAPTPEERADIIGRASQTANALVPKVADAQETARKQFLIGQTLSRAFPLPTGGTANIAGRNTDPAAGSPELDMTLGNLADQYFQNSTDKSIKNNPIEATNAAYQQLIRMKMINPNQPRDRSLGGQSTYIHKPVLDKQGNPTGDTKQYFRVDLLDPKTQTPIPPGQAPLIKMDQALSSTVVGPRPPIPQPTAPYGMGGTPSATAPATGTGTRAAPGTDGGPAPGQREGHTGKGNGGQIWVVTNGRWVATAQ